ncbi:hypothetical protein CLV77_2524 [Brevirhabdus pacifica]|nr:hypothetical protein [Brevirhabdus pacifica]PJJ82750.1 hypothetical protein CLV77_2524 [Brevirhabdus pacifica]
MILRVASALLRAFLMMTLIVLPSLLVPTAGVNTHLITLIIGLSLAVFVFTEYMAQSPGILEFRDAPPYNRMRFLLLFGSIILAAVAYRAPWDGTPLVRLVYSLGLLVGQTLDVPFSPMRLASGLIRPDASPWISQLVYVTLGLSFIMSVFVVWSLLLILRVNNWPSRSRAFNLWVNLPTFDPTSGGDVVASLVRSARINISLAILLPFFLPLAMRVVIGTLDPSALNAPLSIIWIVSIWMFLPTCCVMKAIVMHRLARLVSMQRRLDRVREEPAELVPA